MRCDHDSDDVNTVNTPSPYIALDMIQGLLGGYHWFSNRSLITACL